MHPHEAVYVTHWTYKHLTLGTGFLPLFEIVFFVWITLIATVETGTDSAGQDIFLTEEGHLLSLFDEIR